jgi:hypothetical protein
MGAIIAVPLVVCLAAIAAFLKFTPQYGNKKQINVFNAMVLGLGLFLWLGWYFSVNQYLAQIGVADKYGALFGIGAGAAFMSVYTGGFFCVRNFFVFRPKDYRPGLF